MTVGPSQSAPRISVVIPAHNAGEHLGRALQSVLAQTRPADEILVVDDGSTDKTAEVTRSFGSAVTYLRQDQRGAGAARNQGIEAATGNWIAFLDADDEWRPEKLQLQLDLLARNPELVWAYCGIIQCWCSRQEVVTAHAPATIQALIKGRDYFESYLTAFAGGIWASTINLIIRRDILVEVGLFAEDMPRGQDTDLWLRIASRWPRIGYVLGDLTIYHRDVPASITKSYPHDEVLWSLYQRNRDAYQLAGRLTEFEACITRMVCSAARELIGQGHVDQVRTLLKRFSGLLPGRFRMEMRLRVCCPRLAKVVVPIVGAVKTSFRRLRGESNLCDAVPPESLT